MLQLWLKDPNELMWVDMPDVWALIFHSSYTHHDIDSVSKHIIGAYTQSKAFATNERAMTMDECGATNKTDRKCSEFLDAQMMNTQFIQTYQLHGKLAAERERNRPPTSIRNHGMSWPTPLNTMIGRRR